MASIQGLSSLSPSAYAPAPSPSSSPSSTGTVDLAQQQQLMQALQSMAPPEPDTGGGFDTINGDDSDDSDDNGPGTLP